jgi:hypothetical protein
MFLAVSVSFIYLFIILLEKFSFFLNSFILPTTTKVMFEKVALNAISISYFQLQLCSQYFYLVSLSSTDVPFRLQFENIGIWGKIKL